MKKESEWEIFHEPMSFIETRQHLMSVLKEHALHKTSDPYVVMMRTFCLDESARFLDEAQDAYQSGKLDHAWHFLVRASEAIGFLKASQGAIYPREDEVDLRSSLRKSGSKGGKTKGLNAKKIEDEIAVKLRAAHPPKQGWNKFTMRKEYNKIVADLENYNDADRKWRALFKRADIQGLLSQDGQ
jgi:hypothetical protein